jgi:CHAD domain-containing protein
MPHRIGKHEDIGAALVRLIADDLAATRSMLRESGPAEAKVHRARQRLKRVRSMLRVLRPALGRRARHAADKVREAARLLAGARDADAAAASARSLRAAAAGEDAGFDRVVAKLDLEVQSSHGQDVAIKQVFKLLDAAEHDLGPATEPLDGTDLLRRAIDRAYRRGCKARHRATFSLATPDLHRWRKSVKDLWHLLRLARKRLPSRAGVMATRLERLSELLGLDHDHALLAEKLALSPASDPALMQQLAVIARQRRALEAEAFALGAHLCRYRPKEFQRKLPLK